jgi:hypothetical protein
MRPAIEGRTVALAGASAALAAGFPLESILSAARGL